MINIYLGKTNYDCQEDIIERLKQNNCGDTHHIVLVPDRVTVLTEKRIFEKLKIESTCNIEVLTLSRLASRIIKNQRIINKQTSCMILQKLLKENRNELKCFTRQDSDLAESIYGTIAQFKSCKISFDDVVVKTENKLLQDKLSDIALLYSKYQKELNKNNVLDSLDRLDLLQERIGSDDIIKNSFIYVINFDGFTYQGYQIVSLIAKNCIEFNIGIPFSDGVNSHIYNQNYIENISKIDKNANVIVCNEHRKGQFAFLQDNLFCFEPNKYKISKSDIELFEGNNFEQELNYCCAKLKEFVKSGGEFNQVNIAIPNLNSKKQMIQKIFDKFNFDYYLDTQEEFRTSVLNRFIESAYELIIENFSSKSVLSFLKNPLVLCDKAKIDDFEDYLLNYSIDEYYELQNCKVESNKFYENFEFVKNYLFKITNNFAQKLITATTFDDFVDAYQTLLQDVQIEQSLDYYIKNLAKENRLKQVKLFEQFLPTLQELFDNILSVLHSETCDHKLFFSTLQSGINASKLSTPPISTNCVFVGDCSQSFFENKKLMIILDASEQEFPKTTIDCGLISDDDIEKLSEKYKLEPSISEINKKEIFKAYELLLKSTEKLIVSYNFLGKDKSKIYEDISNMFVVDDGVKFSKIKVISGNNIDFYLKNNNLCVAKNNLIANIRSIIDGQVDEDKFVDSLYYVLRDKLDRNFLDNFRYKNVLKLTNNVFFKNNIVSTTQIEKYMTCPFLHFVSFGLKLKEKNKGIFDSLNIGNIMHLFAYNLLKSTSLPIDENKLNYLSEKIFTKIIEGESYKSLLYNKQNIVLINNLKKEALRLALALNEQARHSKFVPKYLEVRFDDKREIKTLKIERENQILSLVGQVDRIDIFDKYFRIIDYKTGKCSSSLQELFFGKKIQLETYIKVVKNSLKLDVAGGYYFPIKSTFVKQDDNAYEKFKLKGRTLGTQTIAIASDDKLLSQKESDIVEIKLNKSDNDQLKFSAYSNIADATQLERYSEYAYSLIKNAIDDIMTLDITPYPICLKGEDPCKNCKFASLCRFDTAFGNIKRRPNKNIVDRDFEDKN